ncbi:hypothetical protein J437_LFUL012871 [Ladona fulva]|uniref:Uncharacterized protein n=1 Tax=Ladona fulva TaxID=123851 RepID=A0A8K0KFQ3_LADFU|nr:hypothetical protein J437_LFUL012871 [Ladona fulva]
MDPYFIIFSLFLADVIGGGSGAVPRSFPTPVPSSILSQSHPSPVHPLPPVTSLLPSSNSPSIFPGAPPHLLPPASPFQAPPPPPSIAHIPPPLSSGSGPHPPIVVAPAPHSVVAPVDVAPASIEYEGGTQPFPHDTDPVPTGPMYFATENSTTVTAQIGSTALVPCVVRNIGDGMVSD